MVVQSPAVCDVTAAAAAAVGDRLPRHRLDTGEQASYSLVL